MQCNIFRGKLKRNRINLRPSQGLLSNSSPQKKAKSLVKAEALHFWLLKRDFIFNGRKRKEIHAGLKHRTPCSKARKTGRKERKIWLSCVSLAIFSRGEAKEEKRNSSGTKCMAYKYDIYSTYTWKRVIFVWWVPHEFLQLKRTGGKTHYTIPKKIPSADLVLPSKATCIQRKVLNETMTLIHSLLSQFRVRILNNPIKQSFSLFQCSEWNTLHVHVAPLFLYSLSENFEIHTCTGSIFMIIIIIFIFTEL